MRSDEELYLSLQASFTGPRAPAAFDEMATQMKRVIKDRLNALNLSEAEN